MTMTFHPVNTPDFLPVPQLRQLQLQRLRIITRHAWERVALFRKRMDERGLGPEDIRSLDDLGRLPFTLKSDLRDTYPFGLFAVDIHDVVRLHASSGTTGKPIVVAYTRDDIAVWANAMERCFASCGLDRHDIIQNSYGYGLFTGGLGAHYGGEALGATVIPTSGGNTERQLTVMKDFGVTAICCTPSYFVHLIERIREMGIDPADMPLKTGIFGAEPWSDAIRAHIQESTGIRAYDIYGLSEIVGPGVGCECSEQNGLHILEDCFYPEIIDPQTGTVLPDGEEGELVLTTLRKFAMPMIRYRTRDITAMFTEPCACGRSMRRIRRITRRSDDMLIIRGVNVYPGQIETAMLRVEGTTPHYQLILTRSHGLDQMIVEVEVTADMFSDRVGAMENVQKRIQHEIESITGIRVGVSLVGPGAIPRSEGKAKRVIDRRSI